MKRSFILALSIAGCLCGAIRAEGLLQKLPDDKAYAKYDLELTVEGQGAMQTGELTLKSVGSTFEDGEKCRWIEMEFKLKPSDGEGDKHIYKLLLPEKNLKAGANPLEKILRAWHKQNEDAVVQFTETTTLTTAAVGVFLSGPSKDSKALDKQFEDSKIGNVECAGVKGSFEQMLGPGMLKVTSEVRTTDKAPFGSVRGEYQFEIINEQKTEAKATARLKLVDVGTEAVSALPDSQ